MPLTFTRFRFQSERGFTLIELLAVVAVIGILVAVLIPVISSIRESAYQSQCASNLRQIMSAFQLYASENNGYLPAASRATDPTVPANQSPNSRWSRDLEAYLPQSRRANSVNQIWDNEVFVCPAAVTPSGKSDPGDIKMAYNASQALYGENGDSGFGTSRFERRKLMTIEDPAKTPLVYDAPLLANFDVQSNYYATWPQVRSDFTRSIEDMRYLSFRHKDNMNVLMADGAVHTVGPEYLQTLDVRRWRGLE